MQHEIQTPSRAPSPVFCPFCGAGVSLSAPTCAVCGVANPAAQINATLDLGTSPEDFLPEELLRTFGSAPSDRLPPPQIERSCSECDAKLDLGAKFCWSCGEAVGVKPPPRPEPPREKIVPLSRPSRHIALAEVEPEAAADPPPPAPKNHDPMDYLDAQLGLKAPGTEPAPEPKPSGRRPGRHLVLAEEEMEVFLEKADAPPTVSRAPRAPRSTTAFAWAVPVAIGFATFALVIALLVHLLAPNAVAGYSPAELDLKVQMRAVEWLLAGVLVALVGMLLKR